MAKRKVIETSKEAYKSLDPNQLNETYRQILFALSRLGEGSYEEIASYLAQPPAKIWKRLSELAKSGLIYRPGNKRMLRSGRMGFTWMLTNGATPKTTASEKALKGKSIADFSRDLIQKKEQPKLF